MYSSSPRRVTRSSENFSTGVVPSASGNSSKISQPPLNANFFIPEDKFEISDIESGRNSNATEQHQYEKGGNSNHLSANPHSLVHPTHHSQLHHHNNSRRPSQMGRSPFGPNSNRWLDNGTFHFKQVVRETDQIEFIAPPLVSEAINQLKSLNATGGDDSILRHRNSIFTHQPPNSLSKSNSKLDSGKLEETVEATAAGDGEDADAAAEADFTDSLHPNSSNYFSVLHWRGAIAEFICTSLFFTLLFSIIIASSKLGFSSQSSLLLGCYGGGILVAAFIYMFGNISGAYFSISITLATLAIGKHSARTCLLYVIAQLTGSIFSMCLITVLYPNARDSYRLLSIVPDPGVPAFRVIAMEAFLAFISVYVFLNISHWHGSMGGYMTGLVSSILVFIGAPVSGGVINVARVFGPALFSGVWDRQYLYWIGTGLGSVFAGFFTMYVHNYVKLIDWSRDLSIPMHNIVETPDRFRYKIVTETSGGMIFTIEHWAGIIVFTGFAAFGIAIGTGLLDV